MEVIKGTKFFTSADSDCILECSNILDKGGLVAFPTETVYGLGADALNSSAVKRIFQAKKRPADNPLIVHIASLNQLTDLVSEIPEEVKLLSEKFWPGPLTLVLKKKEKVPDITTGGLDTVAVRFPNHNLALELLQTSELPIAAPSANLSGRPSPTTAQHVATDLAGDIEAILDGGKTGVGVESTILSLTEDKPVLLRPGGITYEDLREVLGEIEVDPAVKAEWETDDELPLAPGMKYKHYSPQAEVLLIEGESKKVAQKINALVEKYRDQGRKVGIMATKENANFYAGGQVKVMGDRNRLIEISANIFGLLREFDELGVDIILVEGLPTERLGLAIMNRLRKAAGYQIIKV